MAPTDKQQNAAFDPLRDVGIMSYVFALLPGQWLYLGAVCSEWKAGYARIADHHVRCVPIYDNNKFVTCGTKTTLFSLQLHLLRQRGWRCLVG
jgi:hypothetical protein